MNYSDLIGCKFKIHGRNKEEGFDCYGLVIEVLKRNGLHFYDVFYEDFSNNGNVNKLCKLSNSLEKLDKEEDLCIIEISVNGNPTHIGVYIGNGKMIHCTENLGVIIEPIRRYCKRIEGYYKVSNS